MTPNTPNASALVAELLAVLDEQIALLELRRSQLESLSETILDRDDARMEVLLGEIEQTMRVQQAADLKLHAVRNALASAFACPPEEIRLGRLIARLEGDPRLALDYRRQRILRLTEQLRQQHLETCLFLMESSRINRMLLESLFPNSEPVITYGAGGQDQWRPPTPLVDAEL